MNAGARVYDKAGASYVIDHEDGDTLYVRPMLTIIQQSTSYHGDDFHEEETTEPAGFILPKSRDELFGVPPVAVVNAEIAAKSAELKTLKVDAARELREIKSQKDRAERELLSAQRQLDEWMKSHKVMTDLGKLLDGQILYPLSVRENPYHHSREIPIIPKMQGIKYIVLDSGDFEKGQKWRCQVYGVDSYGHPFRFFDTDEERAAVIVEEFGDLCRKFRQSPNFDTAGHTYSTTLDYGTLMKWVKTHPALTIPDDIEALKREHDAEVVRQRKEKLAAELAQIEEAE